MHQIDIAIIGEGLAGSIAGLALARAGRKVAIIAPHAARRDERTTALMEHSIRFIDSLGLWQEIAGRSAALSTMQILDGTGRLFRAPPAQFRAADVGLAAFGYNIPNKILLEVLSQAIEREVNIVRFDASLAELDSTGDAVRLLLSTGETLTAAFVIGADGRGSKVRESAGIDTRRWSYPQTAIVLNFSHERPHANVSTEFHTETGPATQVPLPGQRSSLVWVVRPEEASRLLSLTDEELSHAVEQRLQSLLGKVTVEPGVESWPLSSLMAERFGKGRIALIGEAAHAFPPIGAQGLNLSLRDVIELVDLLKTDGSQPIAGDIGDRFNRKRRPDIMTRTFGVDVLNRSLLSDFLPVQIARAAGLHLVTAVGPLRNLLMREGIEPGGSLKDLAEALKHPFRRKKAG
ncbi:UbiH/UbiF family hydroxylase [Rhizobium sp. SSA_523]|uniref:UbiH/UbiF family hydroxylase n=1 Tax=Rhizobium sp. SSA_523 TaxID=2952477 RepID=UPI002090ABBF|nr:UbiH/UbiF family hydroxylase [Rhizobium sp. SSA_523]MCO5733732.1 UbiH/UbiF family hydroxylase [Rhizobium sp. SSA_523]WKC24993.1 UbiH/UbiF family hydroxylase [Rhizobium sp. SSA_523]